MDVKELLEGLNQVTQTASIKLIKNTRGYQWEIKIIGTDIDEMIKLDNRMNIEWGLKE